MTEWAEDVYRELRTLITVYAGIEETKGDIVNATIPAAGYPGAGYLSIWCTTCKQAFRETASQHLARHSGTDFGWTSTPPPRYG